VAHEAAHIFHNCKRRTIGLAEKGKREWLLDIEYRKRETFAYACEAYARILERAPKLQDRPGLAIEYASKVRVSAERVDPVEVKSILLMRARQETGGRSSWAGAHRRRAGPSWPQPVDGWAATGLALFSCPPAMPFWRQRPRMTASRNEATMPTSIRYIPSVLYLVVAVVCLVMARKSILARRIIPFHEAAAGKPWEDMEEL